MMSRDTNTLLHYYNLNRNMMLTLWLLKTKVFQAAQLLRVEADSQERSDLYVSACLYK